MIPITGKAYCRNITDNSRTGTSGTHGEIAGTLKTTMVDQSTKMKILNHLLHKFGKSDEPTLILSCEGEAAQSGGHANDAKAVVTSCMGVKTLSIQPYKRRPWTGEYPSK